MILPLLLAISAPQPIDDYPEEPSPCLVAWGDEIGARFPRSAENGVDRRCRELVSALGYEAKAGDVRVTIEGELLAFTVTVSLMDGEKVLAEDSDGEICECGSDDLATFAAQRVARAIEKQRGPDVSSGSAGPSPDEKVEEGGQDNPPLPEVPQRHALRWIGVALGVTGAATLITGAALRPMEKTSRSIVNEVWNADIGPRFSPRNTAIAIGVGSVALGVGIGLVVTDVILTRKRRKRNSTTVSPSVSATSAAIVLRSRF